MLSVVIVGILDDVLYHLLLYDWVLEEEHVHLLDVDLAHGAIGCSFNLKRRVRVEENRGLSPDLTLVKDTQTNLASRIKQLEHAVDPSLGNNDAPKIRIILGHDTLLWLVEAQSNQVKKLLDLFFVVMQHAKLRKHWSEQLGYDLVRLTWLDFLEENLNITLEKHCWLILVETVANYQPDVGWKVQIYHCCVCVRQSILKKLLFFVKLLKNEGQLSKNIGVDDSSEKKAETHNRCLQYSDGPHVTSQSRQHCLLKANQILGQHLLIIEMVEIIEV